MPRYEIQVTVRDTETGDFAMEAREADTGIELMCVGSELADDVMLRVLKD